MTPHGVVLHSVANARSLATHPRVLSMVIVADRAALTPLLWCQFRADTKQSGPTASNISQPLSGRAIVDVGRKPKSP